MAHDPSRKEDPKTQPASNVNTKPAPKQAGAGNGQAGNGQAGNGQARPAPAGRKPLPKAVAHSGGAPAVPKVPQTPAAADDQAGKNRVREELEEMAEEGAVAMTFREWLRQAPSWLTSLVVHVMVILILGILWLPTQTQEVPNVIAENLDADNEQVEEVSDEPLEEITEVNLSEMTEQVQTETTVENVEVAQTLDTSSAAMDVELADINTDQKMLDGNLLKSVGAATGNDFSGRGDAQAKAALLAAGGGSPGSEKAVGLALEWLANHQLPDGSWSFDHRVGPCQGRCGNPGSLGGKSRKGSTGMALLPFLGAGQTHKKGKYSKNIYRGLMFLGMQQKPDGSFHEPGGSMYSHGICSIALCEAYAMTQDKGLQRGAQAAINFIVMAQDPTGGGWRYSPKQAGDTSVVGWQVMALKSGHMGYLAIPPQTIAGANNFLNTVQSDSGAQYGYTAPGTGDARTAVGLLCRMYMGWKKDHDALQRGADILSRKGPSKSNMYYNYYATQVMHHLEGDRWKKWNDVMRDQLVDSQDQAGHEKGSWFFKGGDHGAERGGRLYTTCMCCMTLEVYYRHLPIYRKQAAEDDFDE